MVAARRIARDILQDLACPVGGADGSLARLVLTAACLHCASAQGGESRRDLALYLKTLCDDPLLDPALLRSPMQFVRYAAAELQALAGPARKILLDWLLATVSEPMDVNLSRSEGLPKNSHHVRI